MESEDDGEVDARGRAVDHIRGACAPGKPKRVRGEGGEDGAHGEEEGINVQELSDQEEGEVGCPEDEAEAPGCRGGGADGA